MEDLAQASRKAPGTVEPDVEFIATLRREGGTAYRRCFQCGTCSATCGLSPDREAFPRKEMAWAAWGMKERLLRDPDIWLCHQCNDCSLRCPRGARPGDVLAVVRRLSLAHYAVPSLLAVWLRRPAFLPVLLGFSALVLALAALFREPLERSLGLSRETASIVYPYSPWLPHWLLNGVFGLFSLLVLASLVSGAGRLWRGLKAGDAGAGPPARGRVAAIGATLRRILLHEQFSMCTTSTARSISHVFVFFGFLALGVVSLWVILGPVNPLVRSDFVYPFGFWSPWKLLANLGGAMLLFGCVWMVWERLEKKEKAGTSTYFDWAFVMGLALVAFTGFVAEGMHYLRLVPHRHVVYFVHLVLALSLLISLPFSKFAHLLYRATAMVYAEHSGRDAGASNHRAPSGEEE